MAVAGESELLQYPYGGQVYGQQICSDVRDREFAKRIVDHQYRSRSRETTAAVCSTDCGTDFYAFFLNTHEADRSDAVDRTSRYDGPAQCRVVSDGLPMGVEPFETHIYGGRRGIAGEVSGFAVAQMLEPGGYVAFQELAQVHQLALELRQGCWKGRHLHYCM